MLLGLFFLPAMLVASPIQAESFQAWAARASRQEKDRRPTEALASYANALSAWTPQDGQRERVKIYCSRGALRDAAGDESGAIADYGECLAGEPRRAKTFLRRGELLLQRGRASAAIDDFYKATALDIRLARAYALRARAYELQGDSAFVREDLKHACAYGDKPSCEKIKGPATRSAPARPKPRFSDCLASLDRCGSEGSAFGACVEKARRCERSPVRGCCPSACIDAYRKRLNAGESEGRAFREIFTARPPCAALIDKR